MSEQSSLSRKRPNDEDYSLSSKMKKVDNDKDMWVESISKSYNRKFWYNSKTGESVWVCPFDNDSVDNSLEMKTSESNIKNKVAIIVPFRDLHPEQKRDAHLKRFLSDMPLLFDGCDSNYKIYIIEQSDDGKKFNRGKLLNIGYKVAKEENCNIFVFHDVDLLPSPDLLRFYTTVPSNPVHIANAWDRYNGNQKYFGGIVAFSSNSFESINGYPNNYWGWGGEDDELYKRTQEIPSMSITKVEKGPSTQIIDMEEMSLSEKLKFLKDNSDWKCMYKTELLKMHASTWKNNGLSNLKYSVIRRIPNCENGHGETIVVNVMENSDDADQWAGIDFNPWKK